MTLPASRGDAIRQQLAREVVSLTEQLREAESQLDTARTVIAERGQTASLLAWFADGGFEVGIWPMLPDTTEWRVVVNDARSSWGRVFYGPTLDKALMAAEEVVKGRQG